MKSWSDVKSILFEFFLYSWTTDFPNFWKSTIVTNRNNPRDKYRPRNPVAKNLMDEREGIYRLKVVPPKERYKRIKLHPKDITNLKDLDEYQN